MVEEGLRAKMMPADPLTGALFVDLGFEDNVTKQTLVQGKKFALLPSVKSDAGGMMDEAQKLLQKLNSLPLEQLLTSLNKVVDNSDGLLSDLGKSVKDVNALTSKKSFQAMPNEIDKTLKELTKTLAVAQKTIKGYDNQSLLTRQIAETLKVVTETSKSMQQFLNMLNRKPDSLIFGD
jgi:paraquat-inducible protein B